MRIPVLLPALSLALLVASPLGAQIRRHPTGVNVNANGPTTVFITFGNLDGYVPAEALWCGELISASPALGERCAPGTVYGQLPLRYDLSRRSGQPSQASPPPLASVVATRRGGQSRQVAPGSGAGNAMTDIMSIPQSVARRAYQAAQRGENSAFFYVRRFVDPSGIRPDQYVAVTCRLTGGGARTPFALTDVRLAFEDGAPVLVLDQDAAAPEVKARILYNGTGQLRGRWEIVLPGDEPPSSDDLLTEATLPIELRGRQRRYTEIGRFSVFLPPTGEFTLQGPDVSRIPTFAQGQHMILLRIEAADDKEGDSDLEAAGAGRGVVHTGAVAGFPIPPLRYYIGGRPDAAQGFGLIEPADGATIPGDEPIGFSWSPLPAALLYRLEVESGGEVVLDALVAAEVAGYRAPTWLRERLIDGALSWRVVALGANGRELTATPWRSGSVEEPGPDPDAGW